MENSESTSKKENEAEKLTAADKMMAGFWIGGLIALIVGAFFNFTIAAAGFFIGMSIVIVGNGIVDALTALTKKQ